MRNLLAVGIALMALVVTCGVYTLAGLRRVEPEIAWLVRETPHFQVKYTAGSPAEANLEGLEEIVERHYASLAKTYALEAAPARKVPYFFHDKPVMSRGRPVWGFTSHGEGGEIHVIYSTEMTDTSPHELRHYVHKAVNPKAPSFFDEGGANIGVKIMGYDFHQILKAKYPRGIPAGLHETIATMGNPYTEIEAAVAYSFCNFLVEKYGEEGFGKMYRVVQPSNYRESLKAYTGKTVDQLNEEWVQVIFTTEVSEDAEKLFRRGLSE
jgi:hypothetical protein